MFTGKASTAASSLRIAILGRPDAAPGQRVHGAANPVSRIAAVAGRDSRAGGLVDRPCAEWKQGLSSVAALAKSAKALPQARLIELLQQLQPLAAAAGENTMALDIGLSIAVQLKRHAVS